MNYKYRGWFGKTAKKRCPHRNLNGIYGDQIIYSGGYRLWCGDCGQTLDGPISLVNKNS